MSSVALYFGAPSAISNLAVCSGKRTGTRFVGRHFVDELVARGHQGTLFNRGTNQVFPDIPQYVLISSISVYREQQPPGLEEDADLISISPETPEHITGETYGGFKVLCENVARCWCASSLLIRPGFILGPYDSTDRFTFWPFRIARYDKVLVPGVGTSFEGKPAEKTERNPHETLSFRNLPKSRNFSPAKTQDRPVERLYACSGLSPARSSAGLVQGKLAPGWSIQTYPIGMTMFLRSSGSRWS